MQADRKFFVRVLGPLLPAYFLVGVAFAEQAETSKHGAWEIQCGPTSTTNVNKCALVQRTMSEEQPSVGIMVAVTKAPGVPNGVIQIFAPPKTFLLEGAGIKVDDNEFGRLPFFRCTEITCAAEGRISDDLLSKMFNGKAMLITIYINPGEGLRHIFALYGFKEGYNSLRE
ncbi:invasion associated locus B family protein [Methylocystis sp.]|uniref:invasion associated locus B family protein n=1 Tax=Methylocystis sp. TaxID=1911079 RepID=UPI0025F88E1E|nr:invasion associated locus B family protein [Methylocystis sp.]